MGPDGKAYDEVRVALAGGIVPLISVTESGETVISIALPIRREQATLGALLMTAQGSDIDDLIVQERLQIMAIAGLVVAVTAILSLYLAGTIAEPMRRLAVAADRVRKNIKNREQIPDFSERPDEIGNLSRALRDMTNALYSRLDAIESFAADVSHELKNPLTSLRNAASLLPAIKDESDRQKLVDIINHDVRRLDRLITDISDASRLDAELARETARPVNMASLLGTLCEITRENRIAAGLNIVLSVQGYATPDQYAKAKDYYCKRSRQPVGPSRREPDRERHIVFPKRRIDLRFRKKNAGKQPDRNQRRGRRARDKGGEPRKDIQALLHGPARVVRQQLRAGTEHHPADRQGAWRNHLGGKPAVSGTSGAKAAPGQETERRRGPACPPPVVRQGGGIRLRRHGALFLRRALRDPAARLARRASGAILDPVETLVHGTCVALGGACALLRGTPGAGKSDLALRFLYLPAEALSGRPALVADDQVILRRAGGDHRGLLSGRTLGPDRGARFRDRAG